MERKKYLTAEQFALFLKRARVTTHGDRDYCMALLTYRHGLRVSELTGMQLDQVMLESGRLWVSRLKGGLSTEHRLEGDEIRALRAWLRERSTWAYGQLPFLFISERGPFTRQAINYLFGVIGTRSGLGKVHPHQLRHSCGYALADAGKETRLIQDYLGHRKIENTVIYTQTSSKRFADIWRK